MGGKYDVPGSITMTIELSVHFDGGGAGGAAAAADDVDDDDDKEEEGRCPPRAAFPRPRLPLQHAHRATGRETNARPATTISAATSAGWSILSGWRYASTSTLKRATRTHAWPSAC